MSYFTKFKTISYDIEGIKGRVQFNQIKNILTRIRMKTGFIQNRIFYTDYFVQDRETPETVAFDFYGDGTLHWMVMYAQQITNPYYDWPLSYYDLTKFVEKKYGTAQLDPHHYEDENGDEVNEPGTPIGNGTEDVYGNATPITNFKYEERLNDERRSINLIRPDYVQSIRKEFDKLIERN